MKGPPVYENWKARERGVPARDAYEHILFTDAHIVAEMECGPYLLINTIAMPQTQGLKPAIVLRLEQHLEDGPNQLKMDRTDFERYHGGDLSDEIAALVSLCLGIRLKAGAPVRRFDPEGDPRGRPIAWRGFLKRDPILIKPTAFLPVLPRVLGKHSLEMAAPLTKLLDLSPSDAVALIRAARLYQDAVWIAESQPELSWVLLVSGVEAAVKRWVERLRSADRDIPRGGSTKKFTNFILEFMSRPPQKRPEEVFQCSWEIEDMRDTLGRVYKYRSRTLHEGIPFPLPMCEPPDPGLYQEKPLGLATGALGAVWVAQDVPILLHTFEYIVRLALLNWWDSLLK